MVVLVGDVPWLMNSLKLLDEEPFPVLVKSAGGVPLVEACGLTPCEWPIAGVD